MTEEKDRKRRHTLADHRYGVDADHVHDHDLDHDHDHDDPQDGVDAEALQSQDEIRLTSVGIDVGSSGTQVVFSRLRLKRRPLDLTGRYTAVERNALFQSPVAFTPYATADRIDQQALSDIIDRAYVQAGLHPDSIDAGAIILTGNALRRENAQAIAAEIAELGGEFVCALAGHHMEAMLAAYGSGSALVSHEGGLRVLNVDIGGGTTKLAVVDDGHVIVTAALGIGGRLLVVDAQNRIMRIEPAVERFAAELGLEWRQGDRVEEHELDRLAESMAERLLAAIVDPADQRASTALYVTDPPIALERIDGVRFSGGVGEFIYRRTTREFGDLGRRLGLALRAAIEAGRLPWPLMPAGECIRATALGASSYGMQLSGRTIYVSAPGELLPRRNLQVLQPACALDGEPIDSAQLAAAVRRHFAAFDLREGEQDVALAFRWRGEPSYERLRAFARGIVDAQPRTVAQGGPLYIVLDGDVAQTLGALIKEEMGIASEVLVLDGVTLWDFDYIDLGRIRMPSHTVPVTIKSLVFKDDPRLPHSHEHHAHALFGAARPRRN